MERAGEVESIAQVKVVLQQMVSASSLLEMRIGQAEAEQDQEPLPDAAKPEPKEAGKRKAKGKAKAKAAPKAKAKAAGKARAAKAKSKPGRRPRVNKKGKGEEEVEDLEEQTAATQPEAEGNSKQDTEIEKPRKTNKRDAKKKPDGGDEGEEGDEGHEGNKKKVPKTESKSFARRPCPTTSPAKDKWLAISNAFRTDSGDTASKWEDWSRGGGVGPWVWLVAKV